MDRDVPLWRYIPVPVSLRRGVKGRPSLNSTPCRWGSPTTLHPRYSALRPHLLRRIGRRTAVGSAARTPGLCRACRASPAPARRPRRRYQCRLRVSRPPGRLILEITWTSRMFFSCVHIVARKYIYEGCGNLFIKSYIQFNKVIDMHITANILAYLYVISPIGWDFSDGSRTNE